MAKGFDTGIAPENSRRGCKTAFVRAHRLNGWQMQNQMQRSPVMPRGADRWSMMLWKTGIDEKDVLKALAARSEQGLKIMAWILRNRNSAFIPETVLEAVGESTRWDS